MQIQKINTQSFSATIKDSKAYDELIKNLTQSSAHTFVAADLNKIHRVLPLDSDKVIFTKFKEIKTTEPNSKTFKVEGKIISNGKKEKFTYTMSKTNKNDANREASNRVGLVSAICKAANKAHEQRPYTNADIAKYEIQSNKSISEIFI